MGNKETVLPPPPPDPRMAQIYNLSAPTTNQTPARRDPRQVPVRRTSGPISNSRRIPGNSENISSTEISKLTLLAFIDRSKVRIIQKQEKYFELWVWLCARVFSQIQVRFYSNSSNKSGYNIPPVRYSINETPGLEVMVDLDLRQIDYQQIFSPNLQHVIIDIFPLPEGPVQRSFYQLTRNREKICLALKKQEILMNGLSTVLLDFYGKAEGSENVCLICLTETRNIMILPCRHLCLCSYCSESLSKQSKKTCPICRGRVSEFIVMNTMG